VTSPIWVTPAARRAPITSATTPYGNALVRPQVDGPRRGALLLERLPEVGERDRRLVEHDAAAGLDREREAFAHV
jgi:hypothetical protein